MEKYVNKNEQNRVWSIIRMAIARLSTCEVVLANCQGDMEYETFQNIGSLLDETVNDLDELIPIEASK